MCLFIKITEHENLKPKIAKKDIFGYKVLLYSNSQKEFYTPCMNVPVDVTTKLQCRRFQNIPQTAMPFLYYIDKAIHLYDNVKTAVDAAQLCISRISNTADAYTFACVYRVKIPKGNKYWIGLYYDMCTKSICFEDIVCVFCDSSVDNTGKDSTILQKKCIDLLRDGVNKDILRKFFYSIDVDKIIREYTEAELGMLEPTY